MIKNPSYKADVKLAKDTAAKFSGKGNTQSVANVNQAQGPRTGNSSARAGKRADFVDAKQTRAPLANVIQDAFAARGRERADHIARGEEGIMPNTRVKFGR